MNQVRVGLSKQLEIKEVEEAAKIEVINLNQQRPWNRPSVERQQNLARDYGRKEDQDPWLKGRKEDRMPPPQQVS